jgi:hypothetical protein
MVIAMSFEAAKSSSRIIYLAAKLANFGFKWREPPNWGLTLSFELLLIYETIICLWKNWKGCSFRNKNAPVKTFMLIKGHLKIICPVERFVLGLNLFKIFYKLKLFYRNRKLWGCKRSINLLFSEKKNLSCPRIKLTRLANMNQSWLFRHNSKVIWILQQAHWHLLANEF